MLDMSKLDHAEIYVVGGYCRDRLLGREAHDHDFVVVGATAQDMINAGFEPIEASAFPVFHHPITRDEFALARTEKKTGNGYHGFEVWSDPSITIEQDLTRRDLTINSMARRVIGWNDQGHAKLDDEVIDPFNGRLDLENRIIRHTSDAFGEDPVRVLRAARFAARYDFEVADDTYGLMMRMVFDGELDHLTAERVWLELDKAMSGERPGMFFDILDTVDAVRVVMPILEPFIDDAGCAVDKVMDKDQRFAVMALGLGESRIEQFFNDLKAPADVTRIAMKTERFRVWCVSTSKFDIIPAAEYVKLFIMMDVIRRVDDFKLCVQAWNTMRPIQNLQMLYDAVDAYLGVNFASASQNHDMSKLTGAEIGKIMEIERLEAVMKVTHESP